MELLIPVTVLLMLCSSEAAIERAPPNPLRSRGGCFNDDTGDMQIGEELSVPGECKLASCERGGVTIYHGCAPKVVEGADCELAGSVDSSAPYPDCCPIQCNNN